MFIVYVPLRVRVVYSAIVVHVLTFPINIEKNGRLIYARVAVANKDIEPEVVCMSLKNKADGFGELKGGMMFTVSLGYARQ